ncbi:MAG TPA: hypothetical protein VEO01_34215, partial [Pseudonocardiaceae bacterium]|nr:hypothetical protein [Pseudonocardiaceae bacterium]
RVVGPTEVPTPLAEVGSTGIPAAPGEVGSAGSIGPAGWTGPTDPAEWVDPALSAWLVSLDDGRRLPAVEAG